MSIAIIAATPIGASVAFEVCPHYENGACQCARQDGVLVTPHRVETYGPPPTGDDGLPIEAADTWFARHATEALRLAEAERATPPTSAPDKAISNLVGLTLG